MTDTLLPKNDDTELLHFYRVAWLNGLDGEKNEEKWLVRAKEFLAARDTKMLEHVIGEDVSVDEANSLAKVRRDGTNGTKFAHDPEAVIKAEAINDDHQQQRERTKQWLGESK
jgi:hypothetical protein